MDIKVHSIRFDADVKLLEFIDEVRDAMNGALEIGVKYDVDVAVGKSWGSLTDID